MRINLANSANGGPSAANTVGTDAIVTFVKWCQGRTDLKKSFLKIADGFGAQVVGVSRWDVERQKLRTAGMVEANLPSSKIDTSVGFAHTVCGPYIDAIKPGSVIFLSEVRDHNAVTDAKLEQWLFRRNIKEIAVMCIGADARHRDLIELHYIAIPNFGWAGMTKTLAPTFTEIYTGRRQGLMMEALLVNSDHAPGSGAIVLSGEILSLSNPAKLTRSEWKICALIANGLSKQGIAKELSLKQCTIQTHLRSIYAKSGYERFHELALHLVSPAERAHLISTSQVVAA